MAMALIPDPLSSGESSLKHTWSKESSPSGVESARILMVGLDAWGAVAARDLAAAGIGAIHLLDDRTVTPDDVALGSTFTHLDLGQDRALVLAHLISKDAPRCRVSAQPLNITPDEGIVLEGGPWDVAVVCVPRDDYRVAESVARFAHRAGLPSLTAYLEGLRAIVGPGVIPGKTACWNCARLRTLATATKPSIEQALGMALLAERAKARSRTYLAPMPGILGHATALAAMDLLKRKEAATCAGRVLLHHLVDLDLARHTVLPAPYCALCGGAGVVLGTHRAEGNGTNIATARNPAELRRMLDGIVDARTGIIKELVVGSQDAVYSVEMPITATAILGANTPCAFHEDPDSDDGYGKGLSTVEAMVGAVGEAIERYSASQYDPHALLRMKAADLPGDFLAPSSLCPYADSQYASAGFPYVRVSDDTVIEWVKGFWLDTREAVFVPALPSFYAFHAPPEANFCQVSSNGLAAGPTLEEAAFRAALELIERDAFTITWIGRRPARRVLLDDSVDPRFRDIARRLCGTNGQLHLYLLDVGLGIPTVMCVVFGNGKDWPGATISLSAHPSPRTAIQKAILEHGQGGPYIRRMMEEGKHRIPDTPEDVHTLADHALYYTPPSRARAFDFLSAGEAIQAASLDEPPEVSMNALVGKVRDAGLRLAVVDLTSPDLVGTPFRIARALGPGFQQIHFGHRLMRLGNPRLQAICHGVINEDPHPLD